MNKLCIIVLFAMILGGCATADRTYTSTGQEGYSINCSGQGLHWGMCYDKAGDLCGARGYDIHNKSSDSDSSLSGNEFGVFAGSVTTRSMLISCK